MEELTLDEYRRLVRAPARRTAKATLARSEHGEQAALFETVAVYAPRYVELELLFAIPNGGERHGAVAAKMKAEGQKAGVPDICLPVARQGFHGLFLELKVGRNTPSPEQEQWMARLREQGYRVEVCHGMDVAWNIIRDYLGIEEGAL